MEKKWSCQVSLVHGVDRHGEKMELPGQLSARCRQTWRRNGAARLAQFTVQIDMEKRQSRQVCLVHGVDRYGEEIEPLGLFSARSRQIWRGDRASRFVQCTEQVDMENRQTRQVSLVHGVDRYGEEIEPLGYFSARSRQIWRGDRAVRSVKCMEQIDMERRQSLQVCLVHEVDIYGEEIDPLGQFSARSRQIWRGDRAARFVQCTKQIDMER